MLHGTKRVTKKIGSRTYSTDGYYTTRAEAEKNAKVARTLVDSVHITKEKPGVYRLWTY